MRKLSISILAVVFAVIAMGATTYAWFTITNEAKINQFEVQVTAGVGFEIAVTELSGTPTVWKSTVTKSEVEALISPAMTLTDLTTTDGLAFFPIKQIGVDVDGTEDYKYGTQALPGSGYVEFEVHFRSRKMGAVNLDMSVTNIDSVGKTMAAGVPFTEALTGGDTFSETGSITAYAMNAARMAFINDTVPAANVILEKAAAAANVVGALDNTEGLGLDFTKGALAYYVSKNAIETSGMAITQPTQTTQKFGDAAYATPILNIAGTADADGWYTGKVTVRIWIEGWDAECLNVIFSDTLKCDIKFDYTPA
ncbi:MAG TPA: hypothetical protein VJZ51_01915 [Bacilli bacterium]|nr:hypothetical protein [Bacilli bacterium]